MTVPTIIIKGNRPEKEEMIMMMAYAASSRSTCERARVTGRAVGAVIVTPDFTNVLAIGYNGPPRNVDTLCTTTPEVSGSCTCVHAEANALIKADYRPSYLVTTMAPCPACARMIINSAVQRVYYHQPYRDPAGLDLLNTAGIPTIAVSLWAEVMR